jgi:carotenoid cleavage dioxygenase-like enzyme
VEKKESRYGPETQRSLVLLLDAYNVPEGSITSVKAGLRKRVLSTGFRAIWVAGANTSEIWRLR